MQNMPTSANSCRVYSLILEQNILVAVVVVFPSLLLISLTTTPLPSPPTHPSTDKSTFLTPFPPISMLFPRESFQQIPPGKGGWCLEGLFELHDVIKAELLELACTCSDTSLAHSPDTPQARFH